VVPPSAGDTRIFSPFPIRSEYRTYSIALDPIKKDSTNLLSLPWCGKGSPLLSRQISTYSGIGWNCIIWGRRWRFNTSAYAIKDFIKHLQPSLSIIVSKGIVTYHDSSQIKSITDNELIRIGKSENSVLRATAFNKMPGRNSFKQFDILMNHLDDTAIVATDAGEFGIWFQQCRTIYIKNNHGKFKSQSGAHLRH
jgi:hypothetical protein